MHGLTSELSILYHGSISLFLYQDHTVLITIALQYTLKLGSLNPLDPFIFLKIILALWGVFIQIVKIFVLIL